MQPAQGWHAIGTPLLAGTVLFSASLANFLNRNDYPFFRLDVGLVVLMFVVISAGMGLVYVRQRQWGRSFLEGFLAWLFVDLNSTSALLALTVGVLVAGFTFWKRKSLLGPMAVLGSVVLLTFVLGLSQRWTWVRAVPGASAAATTPATGKPAVLHIILDEHSGMEGFSQLGPEGVKLRNEVQNAYLAAGFTVFGRAYSQHMHTANAIPHVLNYGRRLGVRHSSVGVNVGPTEHLQSLAKSGYSIRIFQSDFADMCSGAPFASCTTYDSFSLRPLLNVPLSVPERSKMITLKFLTLTELSYSALGIWNRAARVARKFGIRARGFSLTSAALTSSVASFAVLDELNSRLSVAKAGEAHIVHLLIPHYPYVVSRNCGMMARGSWDWRNSRSPLREKQRSYMEQVRCVTTKVLAAVEAFRSSPGGSNGSVIIHGDHGSRITWMDPKAGTIGRFREADLIAAFSTIFAVQTANRQGGYVDEAQPITPLVQEFARRGFKSIPTGLPAGVHKVYLDDENWVPQIEYPMAKTFVNSRIPSGTKP